MRETTTVEQTFNRLIETNCWYSQLTSRTPSHFALLYEYWRRTRLWSQAVPFDEWKFPDIAKNINPNIRADESKLEALVEHTRKESFYFIHRFLFQHILNWAALREAGELQIYSQLPDPFEPLLRLYERGGAFGKDKSGFYTYEPMMWKIPSVEEVLKTKPLVDFSDEHLDSIDMDNSDKYGLQKPSA